MESYPLPSSNAPAAALIVFSGLPGTGKTTLASRLAASRAATYLRIDVIEQTIRNAEPDRTEIGPIGYEIAFALAEGNLRIGQTVIADCVNPVAESRDAWREVAARTGSPLYNIEVICSDPREHRRRVETRTADISGHILPTWASVQRHKFEPWQTGRLVIDTTRYSAAEALAAIEAHLVSAPSGGA